MLDFLNVFMETALRTRCHRRPSQCHFDNTQCAPVTNYCVYDTCSKPLILYGFSYNFPGFSSMHSTIDYICYLTTTQHHVYTTQQHMFTLHNNIMFTLHNNIMFPLHNIMFTLHNIMFTLHNIMSTLHNMFKQMSFV